jgi:formylglycine-generating enzyme required for sulfatase activity
MMSVELKRAVPELSLALHSARACTDELFALIRPDSFYERPIPERHRIVFYLGHLEAFDWNLIARQALDAPSFHEQFDKLFAFGIDPDASGLPQDQPFDWPGIDEIKTYNHSIRERLNDMMGRAPTQLLHVALEHRLMHAETFAYMLHDLPYERKLRSAPQAANESHAVHQKMISIPRGVAKLGRSPEEGFGWDNEFRAMLVDVAAFQMSKYKVTNGQYLAFVEAGGTPPKFWRMESSRWLCRGMFGEIALPLDWPVYVSQHQAREYAAWAGKRLPTEAEYHLAAYGPAARQEFHPDPVHDNFDCQHWDPVPVHVAAANPRGIVQMVGNGWEWTSTVFQPFPGFQPFPFYPGYSAKFFDGQHYVLKGASPRTSVRLVRPSFRNWFRGAYPHAYATFRLVEN